jgi:hypothetical protein
MVDGPSVALSKEYAMTDPEKQPEPEGPHAHQPDGTDSSAEFAAGIADENTIPEQLPE